MTVEPITAPAPQRDQEAAVSEAVGRAGMRHWKHSRVWGLGRGTAQEASQAQAGRGESGIRAATLPQSLPVPCPLAGVLTHSRVGVKQKSTSTPALSPGPQGSPQGGSQKGLQLGPDTVGSQSSWRPLTQAAQALSAMTVGTSQ